MKTKLLSLVLVTSLGLVACQNKAQTTSSAQEVVLQDYGPDPLVVNIDEYTLANPNFRTALWTGKNLQLTLMNIPVGGEVGLEMHHDIDQFLRIEAGKAKVLMGDAEDKLDFVKEASEDFAVFVPAGKWHNIVNAGDEPLKLYSIYAPQEHAHGTVHVDKAAADADEHHHH